MNTRAALAMTDEDQLAELRRKVGVLASFVYEVQMGSYRDGGEMQGAARLALKRCDLMSLGDVAALSQRNPSLPAGTGAKRSDD